MSRHDPPVDQRPHRSSDAIDRRALIGRHSPQLGPTDEGVLSVGNGSFEIGRAHV